MSLFKRLDGVVHQSDHAMVANAANDIEGSGELNSGDFNGDGLTDIFISGNGRYRALHQRICVDEPTPICFIKKSLGSTWWQHGADVMDINNDGYDDVFATGYNTRAIRSISVRNRGYWNTKLPMTG